jgi:hypothetical protein
MSDHDNQVVVSSMAGWPAGDYSPSRRRAAGGATAAGHRSGRQPFRGPERPIEYQRTELSDHPPEIHRRQPIRAEMNSSTRVSRGRQGER